VPRPAPRTRVRSVTGSVPTATRMRSRTVGASLLTSRRRTRPRRPRRPP